MNLECPKCAPGYDAGWQEVNRRADHYLHHEPDPATLAWLEEIGEHERDTTVSVLADVLNGEVFDLETIAADAIAIAEWGPPPEVASLPYVEV